MIATFQHKGLEEFFYTGNTRGINPQQATRLRVRLDAMNAATDPAQLNRPGWNLHQLHGDRHGTWSIAVNGPWRLTFRWDNDNQNCLGVDYEQYH